MFACNSRISLCERVYGFLSISNRPITQILQCIRQISHNAPFCNRNVHVHISVTKFCIVGYGTDALWDLWDGSIQVTNIVCWLVFPNTFLHVYYLYVNTFLQIYCHDIRVDWYDVSVRYWRGVGFLKIAHVIYIWLQNSSSYKVEPLYNAVHFNAILNIVWLRCYRIWFRLYPPNAHGHTQRTENKRWPIWQCCRYWCLRKLSFWQLTVPPVTTKLSNWRPFVFSEGRLKPHYREPWAVFSQYLGANDRVIKKFGCTDISNRHSHDKTCVM